MLNRACFHAVVCYCVSQLLSREKEEYDFRFAEMYEWLSIKMSIAAGEFEEQVSRIHHSRECVLVLRIVDS